MGTRNLTMVISEGKTKIAQYGQWDGYPEGQGKTVLDFLKKCDHNLFRERLKKVSFLSRKAISRKWQECMVMVKDQWDEGMTADLFRDKYPELSRDTGAKVLQLVYSEKANKLIDNSDFIYDSLWCEWVYIIDLDKEVLEVYSSYCHNPLTKNDRFYNKGNKRKNLLSVGLTKSYSLKKLPTQKEFITDLIFESNKSMEQETYNIIINHKFKQ
jgi:hypothetical protein